MTDADKGGFGNYETRHFAAVVSDLAALATDIQT